MKLAFFSNSYLPYLSGITISIKTLKEGLEKLGHAVFVVGPKYPSHPASKSPVFRLPSIPAPYPGYRIVWPYSYKIFKSLKKEKIDIIHAHQPFGVGLAALCLARKMKIPFVYSFHTLFSRYLHNFHISPKGLIKWFLVKYLTWFCNQADTVVVGTEMVRRLLVARKVKAKIVVIPTGIEPQTSNAKLQDNFKHQTSKRTKTLIYTGRLSKEKNVPFLLEAFPEIEKQEPNIQMILVGGGPIEEEVRQKAKEISSKIVVTGQKSREEVLEYCQGADVFVYASRTETQGLVITEAKACGLPIVAVFSGALVDVVQNGIDGYLVPPNQEKFVGQVVKLLKDSPLRKDMGQKALEDTRNRFSSPSVAKKIETVYNFLIT